MTANDDTPPKGQDSIERWRDGDESFPLRDESDENLALALEDWKQETKDAVNDATRALLNDSEPLTDEKVRRVAEAGDALTALTATLTHRVPDEYRAETEAEYQEMFGDDEKN